MPLPVTRSSCDAMARSFVVATPLARSADALNVSKVVLPEFVPPASCRFWISDCACEMAYQRSMPSTAPSARFSVTLPSSVLIKASLLRPVAVSFVATLPLPERRLVFRKSLRQLRDVDAAHRLVDREARLRGARVDRHFARVLPAVELRLRGRDARDAVVRVDAHLQIREAHVDDLRLRDGERALGLQRLQRFHRQLERFGLRRGRGRRRSGAADSDPHRCDRARGRTSSRSSRGSGRTGLRAWNRRA